MGRTQGQSRMAGNTLSIYFGTETGNSRWVAEAIANMSAARSVPATVQDLVNISAEQLSRDSDPALVIISTWNRGKPPFFARRFYADIEAGKTAMNTLRFAVIALGDEHYEHYCACGRNLDMLLEKLGGKRWMPRIELGTDFRSNLAQYEQQLWKHFDKLS